jgi:hypothetical protein
MRTSTTSQPIPRRTLAAPTRAIYSGRDRLGSVAERDGQFIARSRLGAQLGSFATFQAAADAVEAAAPDTFISLGSAAAKVAGRLR